MRLEAIFKELVSAWENTKIEDQKPIDLAIDKLLGVMESKPNKISKLDNEMNRFESFKDDQSKLDNVLSLLKICNRLDIKYNKDIDLNTCNIETIETNIVNIIMMEEEAVNEFKKAQNNLNQLWFATNDISFKTGDDYVFTNSNISVGDIRNIVPYFDIETND